MVDGHMRTNLKDIYAVGDAVEITNFVTGNKGFIPLAGPANRQGRIAADNICGIPSRYQGSQGSSILKVFDLTVAATGINEKTAKEEGFSFDKMFAVIFLISAISLILMWAVELLQKKCMPWDTGQTHK